MLIKEFKENREAAISLIKNEIRDGSLRWEDDLYYTHFQICGEDEDEIILVDYYRDADFTVTSLVPWKRIAEAVGADPVEADVNIIEDFEDTEEFVEVCEDLYEEALKELEDCE